jgi:hypothetical protein
VSAPATILMRPRDSRCRWWAKAILPGESIPLPSAVDGAADVPGDYLARGEEIPAVPGTIILEREERHHRKRRGWASWVWVVDADGVARDAFEGVAACKSVCRLAAASGDHEHQAEASRLVGGAGDVAGMVRAAHAWRLGLLAGDDR